MSTTVSNRRRQILIVTLSVFAAVFMIAFVIVVAGIWYILEKIEFTEPTKSLAQMRREFQTQLIRRERAPQEFSTIHLTQGRWYEFPSDGRLLFGFFQEPEGDGPHPIVIFSHGGFALGQGDVALASQFIDRGYAVFMPAYRGENGNTGFHEWCYGELDDLVAAIDFVVRLPSIDADQVYLAGHSIGGVLTLLAAEISSIPRGAMACGAAPGWEWFAGQAEFQKDIPYSSTHTTEHVIRSPISFLKDLNCPVLLAYGDMEKQVIALGQLMVLKGTERGKQIELVKIAGTDHFTAIEPAIPKALAFFDRLKNTPRQTPLPEITQAPATVLEERFRRWVEKPAAHAQHPERSLGQAEWQSIVDPGQRATDSDRFIRQVVKRGELHSVRFFPGNSVWATSGKLSEGGFAINRLDGTVRCVYPEPLPNPFPSTQQLTREVAALSQDGSLLAIRSRAVFHPTEGDKYWISVHRSEDGELVRTLPDFEDCQFINPTCLLAWKYMGRGTSSIPRELRLARMDRSAILYDLQRNARSPEFYFFRNELAAASPGGTFVIFARQSRNATHVRVRSAASGEDVCEKTFAGVNRGSNFAISSDGREAATVASGCLTVLDLETGTVALSCPANPDCSAVNWIDDSRWLVLDNTFVVRRHDGRPIARFHDQQTEPSGLPVVSHDRWLWTKTKSGPTDVREIPLDTLRMLGSAESPPSTCVLAVTDDANLTRSESTSAMVADWIADHCNVSIAEDAGNSFLTLIRQVDPKTRTGYQWSTGLAGKRKKLSFFGEPLPDMDPSGLAGGVLRSDWSVQGSITASLRIRPQQRVGARIIDDAWWEETTDINTTLDQVELTIPLDQQIAACMWASGLGRLPFPRIDKLGGPPDVAGSETDGPQRSGGYAVVMTRPPPVIETELPAETRRRFSSKWFAKLRSDLGLREAEPEPRDDSIVVRRVLQHDVIRSARTGSVEQFGFVNSLQGAKLIAMTRTARAANHPIHEQVQVYLKGLMIKSFEDDGGYEFAVVPPQQERISTNKLVSSVHSGRWVSVGYSSHLPDRPPSGDLIFGRIVGNRIEAKRLPTGMLLDAVFSRNDHALYLTFRGQLEAWSTASLWKEDSYDDFDKGDFSSIKRKTILEIGVEHLQRVPDSTDLLGHYGTGPKQGNVIRFGGINGSKRWEYPCEGLRSLAMDPDTNEVHCLTPARLISLSGKDGRKIRSVEFPSCISAQISPNGKRVAISDKQRIVVYDVPSLRRTWVHPEQMAGPARLAWSDDGRRLAIHIQPSSQTRRLEVWSFASKPPGP